MKIRGVIFDMDGTITEPYFDFSKIRAETNIGDRDLLDYLREVDDSERERLSAILTKFEEAGVENAKLNRGARELLDYLAKRQIPTALLTRNSRQSLDGVCQKLNLKFDIAFSREDGAHKPAPDPIWQIARRWNVEPRDLLVVGDYKWDLLCAKNAGTRCAILINDEGVPEWAVDADILVYKLDDLIEIIAKFR